MNKKLTQRLTGFIGATLAVFVYGFMTTPQSVKDMGVDYWFFEAAGYVMGFYLIVAVVLVVVLLVRWISRTFGG